MVNFSYFISLPLSSSNYIQSLFINSDAVCIVASVINLYQFDQHVLLIQHWSKNHKLCQTQTEADLNHFISEFPPSLSEPCLVAFGNPVLDIFVTWTSQRPNRDTSIFSECFCVSLFIRLFVSLSLQVKMKLWLLIR